MFGARLCFGFFFFSFLHYFAVQTSHELAGGGGGDEVLDGLGGAKCIGVILPYASVCCALC